MIKSLENLKEMLCEELEELSHRELTLGDLETVHALTDTIKNIYKIVVLDKEVGDEMGGKYSRDSSYATRRKGMHYVRGHYSRDDRKGHVFATLEDMIDDADNENEKNILRNCMKQLENM